MSDRLEVIIRYMEEVIWRKNVGLIGVFIYSHF